MFFRAEHKSLTGLCLDLAAIFPSICSVQFLLAISSVSGSYIHVKRVLFLPNFGCSCHYKKACLFLDIATCYECDVCILQSRSLYLSPRCTDYTSIDTID